VSVDSQTITGLSSVCLSSKSVCSSSGICRLPQVEKPLESAGGATVAAGAVTMFECCCVRLLSR
jgi:hypothetical protein